MAKGELSTESGRIINIDASDLIEGHTVYRDKLTILLEKVQAENKLRIK